MARLGERRTGSIGIRTWPWLKEAIDLIAHEQGLSTANYIERLLLAEVEKHGKP